MEENIFSKQKNKVINKELFLGKFVCFFVSIFRKFWLWLVQQCSRSTFFEIFENILRETFVTNSILSKFSILQNGPSHGRLPTSFLNTSLWWLANIEQKRNRLNDNILRHKIPDSSKICQLW